MSATLSPAERKWQLLEKHSKPLKRGPGLTTFNGIGNVVGGALRDPDLGVYHLQSVWFIFVGIPLFMVGIFLTSYAQDKKGRVNTNSYYFHRKVTFEGVRLAMGQGSVGKIVWASAKSYLGIILIIISIIIGIAVVGMMMQKNSGN